MNVHSSTIPNNQKAETPEKSHNSQIVENFLLTVVSVQAHNKQMPKPNQGKNILGKMLMKDKEHRKDPHTQAPELT